MNSIKNEFIKFIKEYGVVGLALGIIIGNAVSKLVTAIVNDLIMPLIGILTPGGEWREIKWKILGSKFAIGDLIGSLIDFFIIIFLVFIFVKYILKRKEKEQTKN